MNYSGDVDAYFISERGMHEIRETEQKKCDRLVTLCSLNKNTYIINNNKYLNDIKKKINKKL